MFSQLQLVMTVSAPSFKNSIRGTRLTKKASLTAVLTCAMAQSGVLGFGESVVSGGYKRREKITMRLVVIVTEAGCIFAATWICTKSFWRLRPADELLSFRSISRVSLGL